MVREGREATRTQPVFLVTIRILWRESWDTANRAGQRLLKHKIIFEKF